MFTKWMKSMKQEINSRWASRSKIATLPQDVYTLEEAFRLGFGEGYWGGVEDTILAGQDSKPVEFSKVEVPQLEV